MKRFLFLGFEFLSYLGIGLIFGWYLDKKFNGEGLIMLLSLFIIYVIWFYQFYRRFRS